ncbi:MAG TPA: large conductance mechanosensitive channel protein MscL [Ktedonobacteraceae bacterium]|nr:large conductance mechanosensitive channel protein MscL [Ktedonobacteraceae bacterium]
MAIQRFRQVEGRATKTLGGFRSFLLRGNVVDLAVGIMIGAAFSAIVTALTTDVITPLIPSAGNSLAQLQYQVPYTHQFIKLGLFIEAIISFLILAFIVYFFIVLPINSLMNRYKPQQQPAEPALTRDCPYCLSSIPAAASRCAFCTSPLPPPAPPAPQGPPAYGAPPRA